MKEFGADSNLELGDWITAVSPDKGVFALFGCLIWPKLGNPLKEGA